jgi:hypothetical protein
MSALVLAYRKRGRTRAVDRDEQQLLRAYRATDGSRQTTLLHLADSFARATARSEPPPGNIGKPVITLGSDGEGA